MGKIKGNGETKYAIRVEELLRQPSMGQGHDAVRLEFAMKTLDPARHQGAFELNR